MLLAIDSGNPFSLKDKLILITGASSGIGRQTAIECSRMGARLILVARRVEELEKTRDDLCGGDHVIVPQDLSIGEKLVPWVRELSTKHGVLDGLVHSAGFAITMPIMATTEPMYRQMMSINLDASYWLLKGFRQRGSHSATASVVLIGSVSGIVGVPGLTSYCASKAGLIGLTHAAALELVKDSIRVNTISPALVDTELAKTYSEAIPTEKKAETLSLHPMGLGRAEDVAYAAVYLLSNASRWVTGINLVVDGGYTAR
jgi:NAD(P)-dependent dehydrogenase (short-subunit alcohol dehydrogenase family)